MLLHCRLLHVVGGATATICPRRPLSAMAGGRNRGIVVPPIVKRRDDNSYISVVARGGRLLARNGGENNDIANRAKIEK